MPLFTHRLLHPEGEIGLWDIRENEAWFRAKLSLFPEEELRLDQIKGQGRRLEWLAARHLIHTMSGRHDRGALIKDEFGKPHLENSDWQISLSHTHQMAAAIAGPTAVGIDIQVFVPKIDRLAHKYMRPEESATLQSTTLLPHLHVYWCAKETLYKLYSRKLIDFRENLMVEPFTYSEKGGQFKGTVIKDDFQQTFQLFYEVMGNYFLVYGA